MAKTTLEDSRKPTPLGQFKAPRFWPMWILLASMWTVAHLPFYIQIKIGQFLGLLSYYFARQRRHICEVNIRLCFSELSSRDQQQLVKRTFLSNGIGLIEIAISWYRDPKDYESRLKVSGLENLQAAMEGGKGVLLVCAHFTTIEIAAFLFNLVHKMDVTYRPNDNPLFQAAMFNGRIRHYAHVYDRKDVRGAIKSLKAGRILWYAPDQDYGAKHSVFVPFFGNQAASITATSRFSKIGNASVVFFSHYRTEDNSCYHLIFDSALKDYPSGDDEIDAARINSLVEDAVRIQPDQYMWLHKRFKTQAAGKDARPY